MSAFLIFVVPLVTYPYPPTPILFKDGSFQPLSPLPCSESTSLNNLPPTPILDKVLPPLPDQDEMKLKDTSAASNLELNAFDNDQHEADYGQQDDNILSDAGWENVHDNDIPVSAEFELMVVVFFFLLTVFLFLFSAAT